VVFGLLLPITSALRDSVNAEFPWDLVWSLTTIAWVSAAMHSILPLGRLFACVRAFPRSTIAGLAVGGVSYGLARVFVEGWGALSPATLILVGLVLNLVGQKPWLGDQWVVGLSDFSVHIAPVCSGVEGMGLMTAFLLGFIAVFHRRLRIGKALLLVPLVLVLSFVLNGVRIALLLLIGANFSEDIALKGFHSKAGWVFFSLVALISVAYLRSPRFRRDLDGPTMPSLERELSAIDRDSPTPYLLPLLVLTAVGLLSESLQVGVDHYYGLRILAALVVIYLFLPHKRELLAQRSAWLIGLGSGALGFLIWILLVGQSPERAEEVRAAYDRLLPLHRSLELSARVLGSVLVVPLVEELAFRGYLMRRLVDADFAQVDYARCGVVSIVVSSVLFGILHMAAWIPATLCGLLYGLAARYSGSLSAATIGHATSNAGVAAAVLFTGRFDLF
jgi:exosortase E/protease (VPEID-CTERM system)